MTRTLFSTIVLVSLLAPGCKPSEDEALLDLIGDVVDEYNAQNAVGCDCWMELGYATEAACTDTAILPARRRCIDEALRQDVSASNSRLECMLPLEEEYTSCLNDRLVCDNLPAAQPCLDDYTLGEMECIKLPAAVQRDYDDCFE